MTAENAKQFLESFTGRKALEFNVLAQSGSQRINFFAKDDLQNYIVTFNENNTENEAFFYFSNLFQGSRLNTPQIYKISEDRRLYVQEFLGEKTLSEIIEKEGLSKRVQELVQQVLTKLYNLQTEVSHQTDFTKTFEYRSYNRLPVLNDLFYFKNFIADFLEIPYHKATLVQEFLNIAEMVEQLQPKVLMIRDFQARNIMINEENEVFFIDYQSAMEGPAMYDVVSFLYQAKANFPENSKTEMVDFYISQFQDEEIREKLYASLKPMQLMRFLQVLGAYGFRGLVQKKPHFISSIHQGISNITHLAENWEEMNAFPELKSLILKLKSSEIQQKIEKSIF